MHYLVCHLRLSDDMMRRYNRISEGAICLFDSYSKESSGIVMAPNLGKIIARLGFQVLSNK